MSEQKTLEIICSWKFSAEDPENIGGNNYKVCRNCNGDSVKCVEYNPPKKNKLYDCAENESSG